MAEEIIKTTPALSHDAVYSKTLSFMTPPQDCIRLDLEEDDDEPRFPWIFAVLDARCSEP